MRVDGRDVTVTGNLLAPLTRRTNDIVRLGWRTLFLASSSPALADHPQRLGGPLEKSVSGSSAC